MIRVAAFTPGPAVPSARFRVRQYIPALHPLGVEVTEFVSTLGSYPPRNRILRPFWGGGTLLGRVPGIVRSYRYDLTLLQREMLSCHLTLEPFTKAPRLLDVDDAIWLSGDGTFARRLAEMCDRVICGNAFLAEQFRRWNPQVAVVPTAVDTERFRPLGESTLKGGGGIIGWSGSSSGFSYLRRVERALRRVLERHPDAKLRIVADTAPSLPGIPARQMEFVPWTPDSEVRLIQEMTVGIMPLDDSLFSRGKCAFKMLCYMSCSLPVVVSPVGVNAELLGLGDIGFGPVSEDDWIDALSHILNNAEAARQMGTRGRKICQERFSVQAVVPQLARIFRETAAR